MRMESRTSSRAAPASRRSGPRSTPRSACRIDQAASAAAAAPRAAAARRRPRASAAIPAPHRTRQAAASYGMGAADGSRRTMSILWACQPAMTIAPTRAAEAPAPAPAQDAYAFAPASFGLAFMGVQQGALDLRHQGLHVERLDHVP